jgi:hypothetical protein
MLFLQNIILLGILVTQYFINYSFLLNNIALNSKKFRLNKNINGNLLLKQGENLDKGNILYMNENSLGKRKIEQGKNNTNRKIDIEIKRLSDLFFLKKYEK